MPTNYTGNPSAVEAPASAPGAGVAPILALPADGDADNAASVAQAFKACADYIAWLTQRALTSCFGDGLDGAATLDGTNTVGWATKVGSVYTMTRDAWLTDLTVTGASVRLVTAGYRLFGRGTLTTAGGANVNNNGGLAAGGSGTAAGAAALQGTIGGGSIGGAGGSSSVGSAGTTIALAFGGAGGAGGTQVNAGGAGGTITNGTAILSSAGTTDAGIRVYTPALFGQITGFNATGAAGYTVTSVANQTSSVFTFFGGSGGGGGGTNAVNGGGGGGGGAGVVAIGFRNIALANNTDIQALGGGGAASGSTGGGGGGGGGGVILLAYSALSVASGSMSSAVNCAGGAAGAGGGGGAAGTAGGTGLLVSIPLA